MQECLQAGDVAGRTAVAVAFQHGVRVFSHQVTKNLFQKRGRTATERREQQRVNVAPPACRDSCPQDAVRLSPDDTGHLRRVAGDREAIHRQGDRPLLAKQSRNAAVDGRFVNHVKRTAENDRRDFPITRVVQRLLADCRQLPPIGLLCFGRRSQGRGYLARFRAEFHRGLPQ